MNLEELIDKYLNIGYEYTDAVSNVCQDIILLKISKSPYINNITIKGGVVMHNISNDKRRATRDIDIDFIRYSLEDDSIRKFVKGLNNSKDDINVEIVNDEIKELNQQDYRGKRVDLKLTDKDNYSIITKLDLGVHKNLELEQEETIFNLAVLDNTITLLANSKEQIFAEKLKSLLRFGASSTRYKDILDLYYLINDTDLDKNKLSLLINNYILLDDSIRYNTMNSVYERLSISLNNSRFIKNFNNVKNNWLELPINEVIKTILDFIGNMEYVEV